MSRRTSLLGLLVGPLVVLAALAGEASAAFPGENGKIAFVVYDYDHFENNGVYTVAPDGSGRTRIKATDGYIDHLAGSAEGDKLVYANATGEITVIDADGSDAAVVASGGREPSFSPDGAKIVYSRISDSAIVRMNVDGSGVELLGATGRSPVYRPDGAKIAYWTATGTFGERTGPLHLVNPDGSGDVALTSAEDSDPAFSPDGTKLTFVRRVADEYDEVYVTNADGSGAVDLLETADHDGANPDFSPDGTRIVYEALHEDGGAGDVATMDLNGNGRVFAGPKTPSVDDMDPVWLPAAEEKIVVDDEGDAADADAADEACDSDAAAAGKQCTLRAAIETANANDGADRIEFEIAPAGVVHRIEPGSELPAVSEAVTIDATTEPGTGEEPLVVLDGEDAGNANGLVLQGSGSTVRGFGVRNFEKAGIVAAGQGAHRIEGNLIGFDPDQLEPAPNGSGVDVRAPDVVVGGDSPVARNVISANGDPEGLKAAVDGLEGNDQNQDALHDFFASFGTGVVISDGDASDVKITGNWIGPDPGGGRFGKDSGLTSTIGVFVGPGGSDGGISRGIEIGGETADPGTGPGNVISGNVINVLAMPESQAAGVVDGLSVTGNLIGADPDGGSGGSLGGAFGVLVSDYVTGARIGGAGDAANRIQGQIIGVLGAGNAGLQVQGNLIGADEDVGGLAGAAEQSTTTPGLGLHNLIGVLLGDTEGALVGGAAAGLGNRVLGNLIGIYLAGQSSRHNAVLGNAIGGLAGLTGDPSKAELDDLQGLIGIVANGSENDLGDAGAGNLIQSNALGVLEVLAQGGHVRANTFNGNLIGYFGTQVDEREFGGPGGDDGNSLTSNLVGLLLLGWAPTEKELELMRAGPQSPVRKADRELAFTANAAQGPLALVEATTSAEGGEAAVALEPPPGGGAAAAALRSGATTSAFSAPSHSRIVGNRIGEHRSGTAGPNTLGALVIGGYQDLRVERNAIAHNRGGGLMVGTPRQGSGAEPSAIRLTANRIFDNFSPGGNLPGVAALGFDLLEPQPAELVLQSFGVTANDPEDADAGANGRQNHPLIASAERQPDGTTVVTGSLASQPSQSYEVELFGNQRCNAFGSGEGEEPLGAPFQVSTDAAGNAQFSQTVQIPSALGRLTANASGAEGTSEFSPCTAVADAPAEPAPPSEPAPSSPPSDQSAPQGKAKGNGGNEAGGPTKVTVTSDEDGSVTVTGSQESGTTSSRQRLAVVSVRGKRSKGRRITVKLSKVRRRVKANVPVTLKLKPKDKKAAKRLKGAVKRGAVAKATLRIVFVDLAGNRATRKLSLKLR